MNDLSILRAPYMQNYDIQYMDNVQSKENLSWEDIQGLSWTLDEFSFEAKINHETNHYS